MINEYIGNKDEDIYGPTSGWWESDNKSIEINSESEQAIIQVLKENGYFSPDDTPEVDFEEVEDSIYVYSEENEVLLIKEDT
jgi:hypothetical protein